MSQLIDHLADLTGFRDRDVLDVTLVGALRDLLEPQALAIHRSVGEAGRQRWLTRARLGDKDVVASSDPAWVDLDELPSLDDKPDHRRCLERQEIVVVPTASGESPMTLFPLSTDRETVGVLEVCTRGPMTREAQRTVCSILRIYRNFQGLLDYSERDTLTGLLNRKTFDESFLKVLAPTRGGDADGRRSATGGGGHWLGVIDIDHFKRVNDEHGHLIGDEVLLLLSRLMRSSFRFYDRLYRFGGEEFVVLMRGGSEDDAAVAFERLRANVESYAFPRVGQVTVSVGFTDVRPNDVPTAAFERADKAVYHAKSHGRNQVASHRALIERGVFAEDTNFGDMELF